MITANTQSLSSKPVVSIREDVIYSSRDVSVVVSGVSMGFLWVLRFSSLRKTKHFDFWFNHGRRMVSPVFGPQLLVSTFVTRHKLSFHFIPIFISARARQKFSCMSFRLPSIKFQTIRVGIFEWRKTKTI